MQSRDYCNPSHARAHTKGWLNKTLLVMKLVTVFMLATALQVSARGFSQSVTWSGRDVPVTKAFEAIKTQTKFTFFYWKNDLEDLPNVTVALKNEPLEAAVKKVLAGLPLDFEIQGKTVFIRRVNPAPANVPVAKIELPAPVSETVRGRVLNPDGLALEGASVLLKGTKKGTSTDRNGRFTIDANPGDVLVISYSGFTTREYTITTDKDFTLTLLASESKLDEVVVKAYGTTTKRFSTSNSGSITAKDIERQPVTNVLTALQGQIPGLFITQGSGAPGATITVRIQGLNSMRGGNNPFYVVDGVPFNSSLLPVGGNPEMWGNPEGSPLPNGGSPLMFEKSGSGSPFSYLNPRDIESIDVLKDADATAIYGSRAANGAIVITTKKGKPGAMRVSLNLQNGWSKIMQRVKLLNAQQYVQMRKDAFAGSNTTFSAANYDMNGTWDTTKTTNWQDYFWGKPTQYFNGQLSLSGGNAFTNYLVSANFSRQGLMLPGNFASKSVSGHLSLNNVSANQRFKTQLSINYLVNNNRLPAASISASMLTLPPVYPSLVSKDGSINWAPNAAGVSTISINPFASLINQYVIDMNNLIANLTMSYQLFKGLTIQVPMGYTYLQSGDLSTNKVASVRPEVRSNTNLLRNATFSNTMTKSYLFEPQLRYQHSTGKLRIEALLGSTIQKNENLARSIKATGQTSDNVLENIAAATTLVPQAVFNSVYRYNALFGSVNLNYAKRYVLSLAGRRDGSSRFGPATRFHDFGSIGGAWILSDEPFMHLPSFVSFIKFNGSYGTTGNDQIGDYTYLDLYSPFSVPVPYQGIGASTVFAVVNDRLQWELTRKANIGLSLGFLKDRILFDVNYSRNRSSNLLQQLTLPSTSGVGSVIQNFRGTVQNTGWEFRVSASGGNERGFSWSANMNLTIPKNKLVSFPDNDKMLSAGAFGYIIGQPLGLRPVMKYMGVDPATGLYTVEDQNGNPTTNVSSAGKNLRYINTAFPEYYAGLNVDVKYKGVALHLFAQGTKKIGTRYYQSSTILPGATALNQPIAVMDYWRNPGDQATYRRLNVEYDFVRQSTDANFEDASFIRIKNVTGSWDLPSKWLKPARINSCTVSANMQNLATITGYTGIDPESGNSALPPFRTITIGLNLTF